MSCDIYVLGNLTIDDIILHDSQQMFLGVSGGNALFAAIGARIWQNSVGLIARASEAYPDSNIGQVQDAGIEVELKRVPYNDIHDWALYEPGGARQFINHLASGTHHQMSITGEEIPAGCLAGQAYHLAPMPTDTLASLVKRLAPTNAIVSLDPHELYLSDDALNQMARGLLKDVQLFLPSREEARELFGRDDPEAAARCFAELGAGITAIKLSTGGSLLYVAATDRMYHIPIYDVETVDPTGAGDSYCGGFLAGYLASEDPVLAACHGTVSASFVVQHVGALNTFASNFAEAGARLDDVRSRVREM